MRHVRITTILLCGAALAVVEACGESADPVAQPSGVTDPTGPGRDGSPPPSSDDEAPTPPDGGTASERPGEPPGSPYVHFDVNHILSTGQSNSVAHEGRPVLSTTQPFGNLMFDVGVMTSGQCEREGCRTYQKPNAFAPLVEGDSFWYPVETMSAGLANEASMLATTRHGKASHDILVSLAGRNGLTYWCLRKGTCNFVDQTYLQSFDESMRQVEDGKALATAAGKSYVVRAVTAVHGESDDYAYATNTQEFPLDGSDGSYRTIQSYADGLLEWQRDFESGIKAVTGQTLPVPLFISQFSGWNDFPRSSVTQMQYEAHVRSGGKVVIVTPAYALEWHEDCRHYTNHGERHLGEYFAKAYARVVLEGKTWEPVRPRKVTIGGNIVKAQFLVPVPPLVLDTQRVVDPGAYGFEVVDAAGNDVPIVNVTVSAPDTVTITLATPPPGEARLRYAFEATPLTCPGRTSGPRGNLRDSDATPSNHGYELFNWAVHFEVPIE